MHYVNCIIKYCWYCRWSTSKGRQKWSPQSCGCVAERWK